MIVALAVAGWILGCALFGWCVMRIGAQSDHAIERMREDRDVRPR